MFDRILVPLDGSATAESILPVIERLFAGRKVQLLLLRAVPTLFGPGADAAPTAYLNDLEEAQRYVRDRADRLHAEGIVAENDPAPAILSAAVEHHAEAIALCTHGRSGIERVVFGSVAETVLRNSCLPVLVARAGISLPRERPLPPWRILVALDQGDPSQAVLPVVSGLAQQMKAQVMLMHVTEHPRDSLEGEMAWRVLEAARGRLSLPSLQIHMRLIHTGRGERFDPAAAILSMCREELPELVAMATHGRSGLSRLTFGSCTETVLRHATVPLLAVRPTPPESRAPAPRS